MVETEDENLTESSSRDRRESRLNNTFVELADTLVTGYDVADLLHTLVCRCVEIFSAEQAAVLLRNADGKLQAIASSSEDSERMELLELEQEEGPCWEALRIGRYFGIEDLETENARWPDFVKRGIELGYRSVDAIPIRLRAQNVGALDLFYAKPGGADPQDLSTMQSLADVAAIGILQARHISDGREVAGHLQTALNSRIAIEQSKGIISQQLQIGMDEAFRRLRNHARHNNLKLSNLAQDVIDGTLRPQDLKPA